MLGVLLAIWGAACNPGVDEVTGALSPPPPVSGSTSPPVSSSASPEPSEGKPAIVVRTPAPGDEVTSPVAIAGSANVFEATVNVVILDASGQELAATYTTAACGNGCRAPFSASLSFFTEVRQAGTIEVFESSAVDGSRLHLVSIPVVLVPGS